MSQPTDVFECPANLAVFINDLRGMQRAANRLDEGENEAFRGRGLQISEMGWLEKKTNEKTERAVAGNWLKTEIETAQTLRMFRFCVVTA